MRIIRDIFWILLIITVPVAIFDKFFRPYCMTVIERMCVTRMKVKSRMSCPVRRKDGTWTTVIKEFEEDIPDLGREELICNKCGRPDYPKCKETVCEAWKYHESKKQ